MKAVVLLLMFLAAVFLFGCEGDKGPQGEKGDKGDPGPSGPTFAAEVCIKCHSEGSFPGAVQSSHALEEATVSTAITDVTFSAAPGVQVTILFSISDGGTPVVGADPHDIRFTIAKLVPGTNGDASAWQSYINDVETVSGTGFPQPDGTTAVQATYERADGGGTFTDLGGGDYSYTLSFNLDEVTVANGWPIDVPYDATLTHRVAMQYPDNITNAFLDVVPDGVSALETRDIAANASCDECHVKLGFHGGDRIAVQYCVTCHNPGTTDAQSGNTVDFKVMIHKIHRGEELPSVVAGTDYIIWGHNVTPVDFSDVVFPAGPSIPELRWCTKCHTGDVIPADEKGENLAVQTTDGNNWQTVPTIEACTSCHDDLDITSASTTHGGGQQTDNSGCALSACHGNPATAIYPANAHLIPVVEEAKKFEYTIVDVADTAPGQFPVITFSVTDPTSADAPYTLANFEGTSAPDLSSIQFLVGWGNTATTDGGLFYTNTGSGSDPAQPFRVRMSDSLVDNGDGTFSVTSPMAIPSTVTGTGVVAMQGHPNVDVEGDTGTESIPVMSVFDYSVITGTETFDRRQVVDVIENCDKCHVVLSLHGNNRVDEAQVCVICHNANATDITRRGGAIGIDGKREEAIDFKYMIHAIHAGSAAGDGFDQRENGIVIYGFSGSPNDFSDVVLPSGTTNLQNCLGCHLPDTNEVTSPNVLATTINTGADIAVPTDDLNITRTSSPCSSCHDVFGPAKAHMIDEGGLFDVLDSDILY